MCWDLGKDYSSVSAPILKAVFISGGVGSSMQSLSLLGIYDMKNISCSYQGGGALLDTNIVVCMPEEEDQKMNHL